MSTVIIYDYVNHLGLVEYATISPSDVGAARRPERSESLSPDNRRQHHTFLRSFGADEAHRDNDGPGGVWGSHPASQGCLAGCVKNRPRKIRFVNPRAKIDIDVDSAGH